MALLEINWSPEGRQLRDFGFIAAALLACLGVLIGFRHKAFGIALGAQASWTVAAALLALGAIAALLAVLAPGLLRPAYIGLTAAGLPIGYAVSHVVMAAIYFGVF
ncbi:MAG: hypothetical protein HY303_08085, partial [Candidatus Wallbacteria bacterium]|nr:hypothetical protein [Candidatus Wallbacteria bacterium]